jgi:hypothetical protein
MGQYISISLFSDMFNVMWVTKLYIHTLKQIEMGYLNSLSFIVWTVVCILSLNIIL